MSADNYHVVYERADGMWAVYLNLSASSDTFDLDTPFDPTGRREAAVCMSKDAAVAFAERHYAEYGVNVVANLGLALSRVNPHVVQGLGLALLEHPRPHIVNGQFQSDKYPTCPPGKVPLSVTDKTAQDLLWEYAQRRRSVDAQFADDLEFALTSAGYVATKDHGLLFNTESTELVGCRCGFRTPLGYDPETAITIHLAHVRLVGER